MIHGNDREPDMTARHAAEALFAPKTAGNTPPVSEPGRPVEERKPRVLPALPPAPIPSGNHRRQRPSARRL